MPKGPKVCIVGAESWGSAISTAVCKNVLNGEFDSRVHIYVHDELVKSKYLSELINEHHENIKYLPGIRLPKNLIAVNDLLEAAQDADILIFATPQSFIKPYCNMLAGNLKSTAYAVSLLKGLDNIRDGEIDLYSHTIAKQLKIPCYSMMNANSAMEMAQGKLCEITIGCNNDAHAKQLTNLLQTDNCMVFSIDDVDGVELCNTLKDLVALSTGFIDGLRLGENTRVACLHLGLKEMIRFITNFNPSTKMSTFFESCGIANSVASSFADKNVTLGNNFVTSRKTIQEIEVNLQNGHKLLGPVLAEQMYAYLEKNKLQEMYPIFSVIHRICQKEIPPTAIVETLRNHPDMRSYSISQMQNDEYLMQKTSYADVVSENVADTIPEHMPSSANTIISGLDDQDGFWKPYVTYFGLSNNSSELNELSSVSTNGACDGNMQFTDYIETAKSINPKEFSFDKASKEVEEKEHSEISERHVKPINFKFKALRVTVKSKDQKAKDKNLADCAKSLKDNKDQQSNKTAAEYNKLESGDKLGTESCKVSKIDELQHKKSTEESHLEKADASFLGEQILYEEEPSIQIRLFEDEPAVYKFLDLMRQEKSEELKNDSLNKNALSNTAKNSESNKLNTYSTQELIRNGMEDWKLLANENKPKNEEISYGTKTENAFEISKSGLKVWDNCQNAGELNVQSQSLGEQNQILLEPTAGASNNKDSKESVVVPDKKLSNPIASCKDNEQPLADKNPNFRYSKKNEIFSVLDPVYKYKDKNNVNMKSDVLRELNHVLTEPTAFASNSNESKNPDNDCAKSSQMGFLVSKNELPQNDKQILNNDPKLASSRVETDDINAVLDPVYTQDDLKHLKIKSGLLEEQNQIVMQPIAFASNSNDSNKSDNVSVKSFQKGFTSPVCKNKDSAKFPENEKPFLDKDPNVTDSPVDNYYIYSVFDPEYTQEDLKHLNIKSESKKGENKVLFGSNSNESKKPQTISDKTFKKGSTCPVCKNKSGSNISNSEKPQTVSNKAFIKGSTCPVCKNKFGSNSNEPKKPQTFSDKTFKKGSTCPVCKNKEPAKFTLDEKSFLDIHSKIAGPRDEKDLKHLQMNLEAILESAAFGNNSNDSDNTLRKGTTCPVCKSKDSANSPQNDKQILDKDKKMAGSRAKENDTLKVLDPVYTLKDLKRVKMPPEVLIKESKMSFEPTVENESITHASINKDSQSTAQHSEKSTQKITTFKSSSQDPSTTKHFEKKYNTGNNDSSSFQYEHREMEKRKEEKLKGFNADEENRESPLRKKHPTVELRRNRERETKEGHQSNELPRNKKRKMFKRSIIDPEDNDPVTKSWKSINDEGKNRTISPDEIQYSNTKDNSHQRNKKHPSEWNWLLDNEKFDETLEEFQKKLKEKASKVYQTISKVEKPTHSSEKLQDEQEEPQHKSKPKSLYLNTNKIKSKHTKDIKKPKKFKRNAADHSTSAQVFNALMSNDEADANPSKKFESEEKMSSKNKAKQSSFFSKVVGPSNPEARKEVKQVTQTSAENPDEQESRWKLKYKKPEAQEEDIDAEDSKEPPAKLDKRTNKTSLRKFISNKQQKDRLVDYHGTDPYIKDATILPKRSENSIKKQKVMSKPFYPPLNPRVRRPQPPFDVRDREYHTLNYRQPPDLMRMASLPLKRNVVTYHAKQVRAQGVAKFPCPVVRMPQFMMRSSVLAVELGIFATLLARYKSGCK